MDAHERRAVSRAFRMKYAAGAWRTVTQFGFFADGWAAGREYGLELAADELDQPRVALDAAQPDRR